MTRLSDFGPRVRRQVENETARLRRRLRWAFTAGLQRREARPPERSSGSHACLAAGPVGVVVSPAGIARVAPGHAGVERFYASRELARVYRALRQRAQVVLTVATIVCSDVVSSLQLLFLLNGRAHRRASCQALGDERRARAGAVGAQRPGW